MKPFETPDTAVIPKPALGDMQYACGRQTEREDAVSYFDRLAEQSADRGHHEKAFWSRQAALALRMGCHITEGE